MGLRPLLAAVKCNNVAMARLLIDHGAHVHQQNGKRSELHALAETQKGPYPAVRAPPHLVPKEKHHHRVHSPHTRTIAHAPCGPTMVHSCRQRLVRGGSTRCKDGPCLRQRSSSGSCSWTSAPVRTGMRSVPVMQVAIVLLRLSGSQAGPARDDTIPYGLRARQLARCPIPPPRCVACGVQEH